MKKIIENVKKGSKKVYGWCKENPELTFMAGMLFTTTIFCTTSIAYNKHAQKSMTITKQNGTQKINELIEKNYQLGQYTGRGCAKNAFINYMIGQGKTYQEAVDIIDKMEYIHYDGNMKIWANYV